MVQHKTRIFTVWVYSLYVYPLSTWHHNMVFPLHVWTLQTIKGWWEHSGSEASSWLVLASRSSHQQYRCYLVNVAGLVLRLIVQEWALRFSLGTALCVYPLSTWQSDGLGMKNYTNCYNYSMKGKQKRVTVREMKLQHKEFLYHNYITISKSSGMYSLYLSDWVSDNSVHPTEWLQ